MEVQKTEIEGLLVIRPRVFEDSRGYFFESYNEQLFREAGVDTHFVQDNQSRSSYGVIRGLHMQKEPHVQAKLLRVLEGAIFDVAVDLRKGSATYGKWYGLEITSANHMQLLIPAGFCHGFSVLSEKATVLYKCDAFYHPGSEAGIRYNDPELAIDWRIPAANVSVSEKDSKLPYLKDFNH
ncbi:MAG: dTDP-4-dehydrorhamnose 3,5-epimerase [Bacteroidales bacterium]|nr:dTDP-4-dehydrorhamnose 3,5-epimerase [Bacteroidales bacterium]MDT8430074.1 dTDP-4-dehydrorhamnose 3,5-epimerase [Bacteroidales bacterium]